MKFWNEILHTALLGSDKRTVDPAALSPDLTPLAEQIAAETPDKEDRFLRLAAIAFNYRQAGLLPFSQQGLTLAPAEKEEKPYCSAQAALVLGDLLQENNPPLVHFWLKLCRGKGQIAPPDILPVLLQAGRDNRSLRQEIIACGGKRAEWLGRLNPDWAFIAGSGETQEDLWQTGSVDQRRMLLQKLRRDDPDTAREWLQQTWAGEDANTKLDLLQQLTIGLTDKDLPFLESLAGEKGKKVKEQATLLLKRIPGSQLVSLYRATVQAALTIRKERGLLGLSKKISLQLHVPEVIDKAVFDSGIEKLSNKKEFTDDEFLLYQLIQWIPLSFLETAGQLNTEELIRLFQDDPIGKKLFPALVLSITHFSDAPRALLMMQHADVFYLDLIPLLPPTQQEYYSIKFFQQSPDSIIQYVTQREEEWSMDLTRSILLHADKNPYQYNRAFFSRLIHLIPIAVADSNPPELLAGLLQLKKQTINVFK